MNTLSQPGLKRVLGLWGLLFYGIVVIQPTAPMGIFGVVAQTARGHVALALLIGMFAMVMTAISYGRMANAFPQAGSAYTYVGRSIHPNLGFMVGWSIILDYLLLPTIATIWCAKASMNILPQVPFEAWVIGYGILFTFVNSRGIKTSTTANVIITLGLFAVIIAFFVTAAGYIINQSGVGGLISSKPYYDPETFSLPAISMGTSIAVLTYMGFDTISTLSEDVKNPRRNIMLATVLLCVITGVLGGLQVYMAQLVWPDYKTFPDVDTAFVHVAGRAGGDVMFHVLNAALLVATIGTAMAAQLGAARLLYAIGRDDVFPKKIFGHLDSKHNTPIYNLLLIGGIIICGCLILGKDKGYGFGAELVNFGAFIAFMGVNAAAFTQYFLKVENKGLKSFLLNAIVPILGFVVCFIIWINLSQKAKEAGFVWMAVGLVYCAYKTKVFSRKLMLADPPKEE
jgi:putrescine importer